MDEAQLIAGLKSQDPRATEDLVDTYGNRLLRSAFALCGNETEAQDLTQDTLLQGIRSIHRFQGRSSIYTWLHGILINLTRHYHRDRKRIVYDHDAAARELCAPEENPSQMDALTATSALWQALARLSAAHREVVVLRYYEDKKIHEIAAQLGISKGTVKSRLHYAIGEMEKILPRELNVFSDSGTEKKEEI